MAKASEKIVETPKVAENTEGAAPVIETPKVVEDTEGSAPVLPAIVEAYFKQYPHADSVLKVGDELFFGTYRGAANEYAVKNGLSVEKIENPDTAKVE